MQYQIYRSSLLPNQIATEGMHHSFGSYHLAAFWDEVKTAAQMGHRDPNVIHSHYKALVLKSEAEKYWKLRPEMATKADEGEKPTEQHKVDPNASGAEATQVNPKA